MTSKASSNAVPDTTRLGSDSASAAAESPVSALAGWLLWATAGIALTHTASRAAIGGGLAFGIFLSMAVAAGLDSAIVDVFDEKLIDVVATTEMLLEKQIYSDSFLKAYRALHAG